MKAIVNTGPGKLELLEWPTPQPGPGQVRIRTGACGICTTELRMIAGWQRTGFPSIPGHEWSGTVDAVGPGVDGSLAGARCVAENVLSDGGEVGFEHPGGYGEFFLTEAANLYRLPPDFPLAVAALAEPLAVALRGLRRLLRMRTLRVEDPGSVLVFGDGPIGLLMLLVLRRSGAQAVSLVGGRPERLALAAELGASQTFLYQEAGMDLAAGLKRALGKEFPYIVEASGSELALQAALRLAQRGGRILVLGDYDEARADFAWNFLLHRELELAGSNTGAGAWAEAVRLAVSKDLPLERLVTHCLPYTEFGRGIALARSPQGEMVKAMLVWEGG